MKHRQIKLCEIITQQDLSRGSLILLAGRPGVGKTKTCCNLFKLFNEKEGCIYFDLDGCTAKFFFDNQKIERIISNYCTAVEIVKYLEDIAKIGLIKIVFIDYWQLANDRGDWFLSKLIGLAIDYKISFIIASQLPRTVERRKEHLPKNKDVLSIGKLANAADKQIVIRNPAEYSDIHYNSNNGLEFFVYRDIPTLEITRH